MACHDASTGATVWDQRKSVAIRRREVTGLCQALPYTAAALDLSNHLADA